MWHSVDGFPGYLTKDFLKVALELDKVESGIKGMDCAFIIIVSHVYFYLFFVLAFYQNIEKTSRCYGLFKNLNALNKM